jgi:hypothetical protein
MTDVVKIMRGLGVALMALLPLVASGMAFWSVQAASGWDAAWRIVVGGTAGAFGLLVLWGMGEALGKDGWS